ncbi:MAG: hypothetical protein ACI4GC_07775 [Acutalibacteraceae bacterium]
MNKKELWDRFIQTGKISDYLNYQKASKILETSDNPDFEAADEFYVDCPNGEDYKYDNEDGRYSDS